MKQQKAKSTSIWLPFGIRSDRQDNPQRDALVQVAIFDGQANNEASDEHHDRLRKVINAHLACIHDSEKRKGHNRNQTGNR